MVRKQRYRDTKSGIVSFDFQPSKMKPFLFALIGPPFIYAGTAFAYLVNFNFRFIFRSNTLFGFARSIFRLFLFFEFLRGIDFRYGVQFEIRLRAGLD